jgi:hypothetical protein
LFPVSNLNVAVGSSGSRSKGAGNREKDRVAMIRRFSLPLFLAVTMLGPLLAAAGAKDPTGSLLAAGNGEKQSLVKPPVPARVNGQAAPAKANDGKIEVTRSDGSTVRTKEPDQKEIKKLVSYMRDGMNRADRAEKQRTTKRVIQYKPGRSRK